MNIVIIILSIIGGLVTLLLVIALFVRNEYALTRSITINKPRQEVFDFVRYLKNQDRFNKWVMADPNMKKEFRGVDGTEGFVYAWESNKRGGKGEQEIKHIKEGEYLDLEVRFEKPFEAVAQTPFATESVNGDQTHITWGMSSRMKYPMNIMLLFGIEKALAKDMDVSLTTLKRIVEDQ
ncbi:MAG: SRPBCC family protein [Niastella sp.]|nr:SRPBCC family protein [Niastella sp.]